MINNNNCFIMQTSQVTTLERDDILEINPIPTHLASVV